MSPTTPRTERDRAVPLHLSIPQSVVRDLKAMAASADRTVSREAVRAFRSHIEQAGEPEPQR